MCTDRAKVKAHISKKRKVGIQEINRFGHRIICFRRHKAVCAVRVLGARKENMVGDASFELATPAV